MNTLKTWTNYKHIDALACGRCGHGLTLRAVGAGQGDAEDACYINPTHPERDALTGLIQAAPELLTVCKRILKDTLANGEHADAEHVRLLSEVIARAEGKE